MSMLQMFVMQQWEAMILQKSILQDCTRHWKNWKRHHKSLLMWQTHFWRIRNVRLMCTKIDLGGTENEVIA